MYNDSGDFARIKSLEDNLKKVTVFAKKLKNEVEALKPFKGELIYERTETLPSRDSSKMQKEIDRLGRLIQDTQRSAHTDVNGIQSRLMRECEKLVDSKMRDMSRTSRIDSHFEDMNDERIKKLQRQIDDIQDTVDSLNSAKSKAGSSKKVSLAPSDNGQISDLEEELNRMRRRFEAFIEEHKETTESLKSEINSLRRQLADSGHSAPRARAAPVDDDETSEQSGRSEKSKDPVHKLKKEVKRLKEQMEQLKNEVSANAAAPRAGGAAEVPSAISRDTSKFAKKEDLEALKEEQKKIKHDLKKVYMKLKKSYRKLRRAYKGTDSETSEFDSGSMLLSMNSENLSVSEASSQNSGDKNYVSSKDNDGDVDSKERRSPRNSRGFMWDSKIRRASEAQKSNGPE